MFKELFRRRDLICELVFRNLKVRYSRPTLGFFWAFLSPLFSVLIFYLVFSFILKVKIEEAPFILYLMSAVFPWSFFQETVMASTTSLTDSRNLVKEGGVPHYFIPVSIALANGFNFLLSLLIMLVVAAIMLKGLPVFVVFIPLVLLMHLALTIGVSIITSIIYVRLRDIKYILETLFLVIFYLMPCVYSVSLIKQAFPPILYRIYIMNPFIGLLNLYRISLIKGFLGFAKSDFGLFSVVIAPLCFTLVVLFFAVYYYKKNKDRINDYLAY